MKLALIVLWTASAFADYRHADYGTPPRNDDWRNPPAHHPSAPTPEPATWLLMGGGLLAVAAWKRRKVQA